MIHAQRVFYLQILFVNRGIRPHGTTFELEYLVEFETEYENILGCGSGSVPGHEKNQKPKFSCSSCAIKKRKVTASHSLEVGGFSLADLPRQLSSCQPTPPSSFSKLPGKIHAANSSRRRPLEYRLA